jgi:hypothetical protein
MQDSQIDTDEELVVEDSGTKELIEEPAPKPDADDVKELVEGKKEGMISKIVGAVTGKDEAPKKEKKTEDSKKPESKYEDTVTLELLKADEENFNGRVFAEYAIEDWLKYTQVTTVFPMSVDKVEGSIRKEHYIRFQDIKYDKETKILSVVVPEAAVNIAPGFLAAPKMRVDKSHYKFGKDLKTKIQMIDAFTFVGVDLIKDQESPFKGLNAILERKLKEPKK